MTKTYLKIRQRVGFLSMGVLLGWAVLSARLFQIQVLDGKWYHEIGLKQAQAQELIPPVRGNIFDRDNRPLTRNIIHYTLAAHPDQVLDKKGLAEIIHQVTGKPVEEYLKKLDATKRFVFLERNLKRDQIGSLLSESIPGFIVTRNARRYYPHDNIGSQIIGVSDVDDRGILGIEKRFNSELTGEPGWIVKQRSGHGGLNPKTSLPYRPPQDGANVQLTIDLEYQSVLQEELLRRVQETKAIGGSGILMNPQTGEILAMASVPDFNPNSVSKSRTESQRCRSITDQFEPGSTYKIVTATAALSLNLVPLTEEFNCENGSFQYKNVRITDHEEYGLLTFTQIIENSSNIGVIKIAERVGENNLYRFSRDFGFGSLTHLNIQGETAGTLRKVSEWSPISLAELSMGHEVGVTVLQLARAYAAIANGGFLIQPRLVKQVVTQTGESIYQENTKVIRRIASTKVMESLTGMLMRVVASGTGTEARIPGWSVAGKTGTAQKYINGEYSNTRFISNFVGFLPANDPQLLGVFVLDEPRYGLHWGGQGAAPLFRRVMERIINMDDSIQAPVVPRPIEKPLLFAEISRPDKGDSPASHPVLLNTHMRSELGDLDLQPGIVPETRGMSLGKAITTLRKAELQFKILGSGKVTWQSPPPGTIVPTGSICTIGLK